MDPNRVLAVYNEVWIDRYAYCDCCTDDDAYEATHKCRCPCHTIADLKKECENEKEDQALQKEVVQLRVVLSQFRAAVKNVLPFLRGYGKGEELALIIADNENKSW